MTAARKGQNLVGELGAKGSGIPGFLEKGARVIFRQLRLQQLQIAHTTRRKLLIGVGYSTR